VDGSRVRITGEESPMRRQLRVTLEKDELAKILAEHFKLNDADIELTVHEHTDRYDKVTGHYFIFTAETE
jgi:hypothetical protein